MILADRPRKVFNPDAANGTVDPTHTVDNEYNDSPQRHVLKLPHLQSVIERRSPPALGTARLSVLSRPSREEDFPLAGLLILAPVALAQDKTLECFTLVQYRNDAHSFSFFHSFVGTDREQNALYKSTRKLRNMHAFACGVPYRAIAPRKTLAA
jgi:hypothetical protein